MRARVLAAGRWIFLLLLVCGVIAQQTHALDVSHDHRSASEHCCRLCHSGHPVLVPAIVPDPAPVLPVAWFAFGDDEGEYRDCPLSLSLSRAPPA